MTQGEKMVWKVFVTTQTQITQHFSGRVHSVHSLSMSSASILLSISERTSHPLSSFELSLAGMFIVAAVTIFVTGIHFICVFVFLFVFRQKKRKGSSVSVQWDASSWTNSQVVPPQMSLWYNLYACPEARADTDHDERFLKKFRHRFRCPYPLYVELCDLAITWKPGTTDAVGRELAPIHLMILTSLRYLGRGWTFDDCEEASAVSEDVCRVFFHEFIRFGKNVLYPKYVVAPNTQKDAAACSAEFAQAGLPSAIGSMDATHVCHERIQFRLRQLHLAQKLHTSARSYNIVTNHRRRILSTTTGHPATWNDKTLVTFN
jgi:hypothetical protein